MVSKEKYPSIFSRQQGVIVLLSFNFFFATKRGVLRSFTWEIFGHMTCLEKLRAVIFDGYKLQQVS